MTKTQRARQAQPRQPQHFTRAVAPRRPLAANETPAATTTEWLYVRDLKTDHAYQRDLSEHRVREIVAAFDPDLLGVLLVSRRANGSTFLLDGQTRHAALVAMEWEDQQVPCLVYAGLSKKDEARIFVGSNVTAVKPNQVAIFRGKLAAGDPDVTAAYNIATKHGYLGNLRTDFKSGSITSPAAIMAVYCHGSAELLDQVLAVASSAWPGKHVNAPVIRGLGMFIAQYAPAIQMDRLVQALARTTDDVIVSRSRALAIATRTTPRNLSAIIQILVADYNLRLRNGRLLYTEVSDSARWRHRSVMLLTETVAVNG